MAFEGIRPVLQLPIADEPGQPIVETELVALAERMIESGVDGLVFPGLGSEAWALTERERDRVVEIAAGTCAGRVPLVVGIDGTTTVATERARRAAELGASGLMVLPPPQATGHSAVVRHFASVADAGGVPVLVQDSPQATGVTLELDTIVAISQAHELASAVKIEIPGGGIKASAAHTAGVEIVAGWGGLGYLEQIERGASGCIPGCDLAPAFVVIDRAARSGDDAAARDLYRRILPLLSFATRSLDLLLLSAKRHLRRQLIFSTESLRAPARTLDDYEVRELDALLDELAELGAPGFGLAP